MLKLFVALLPYEWVGAFITGLRYLLIEVLRSDKEKVQNLIDRINLELIKDDRYNRFVMENPELLRIRIESEVDAAIREYWDLTGDSTEVKLEVPSYSEGTQGDTPLGGGMRLTSPYKDNNEL